MIRLVLAFAIPAGLAAAAAWLVGPNTLSLPGGAPITVAGGERMALQAVDYAGCAPKLLTGARPEEGGYAKPASIRIVKLGAAPEEVSISDVPLEAPAGTSIVIVLDQDGRLVAAGDRPASPGPAATGPECPDGPAGAAEPGII